MERMGKNETEKEVMFEEMEFVEGIGMVNLVVEG